MCKSSVVMNHITNETPVETAVYPSDSLESEASLGDPLPIEGDLEPHFVGHSDHPEGSNETKRLMKEVGQSAKSKAQDIIQQTSGEVCNRADTYVNTASSKVRNLEKAMRDAASKTDGEQPEKVTSGANIVADKLDNVASYLDRKDARGIGEDFGGLVRSNPALVMGGLLAAGFLAGRLLRVGDSQKAASSNG